MALHPISRRDILRAGAALGIVALSPAARADVARFYKGATLTIIVSTAAGGGVDAYSRLLQRHIGRHIPGQPNVIVQNMPGASGVRAANYLYNIAPRDGSVIGHVQRATLLEPLYGASEIKFDAREVGWIGSLNTEWSVALAGGDSGLTSLEDAMTREFPIAAEGPTASDYICAAALNASIGTKFKIVSGYSGKPEELLAIERKEVAGLMGWAWSSARAIAASKIERGELKILAFVAPERQAGYEQIPTVYEFARGDEDRETLDFIFSPQALGRPHFTPPGAPPERVAALRAAFDATMRDPDFIEDARRNRLDLDPLDGLAIEKRVATLYRTPRRIVERAAAARDIAGSARRASAD